VSHARTNWYWYIPAGAVIALLWFFIGYYEGFERGRLLANRKWLSAVASMQQPPPGKIPGSVKYDLVIWNKNQQTIMVVDYIPGTGHMEDGCLTIDKPDYRVYCEVVAFFPCSENCE
jgi:hypothetical protein